MPLLASAQRQLGTEANPLENITNTRRRSRLPEKRRGATASRPTLVPIGRLLVRIRSSVVAHVTTIYDAQGFQIRDRPAHPSEPSMIFSSRRYDEFIKIHMLAPRFVGVRVWRIFCEPVCMSPN